jgi:hypothetical protein
LGRIDDYKKRQDGTAGYLRVKTCRSFIKLFYGQQQLLIVYRRKEDVVRKDMVMVA